MYSTLLLLGMFCGAATVWFGINYDIEEDGKIDMFFFDKPTYQCIAIKETE